jgi:hypothetical protein
MDEEGNEGPLPKTGVRKLTDRTQPPRFVILALKIDRISGLLHLLVMRFR